MSASMQTTRLPVDASATPMFAVAVVLPTPPLPDVIVAILAVIGLVLRRRAAQALVRSAQRPRFGHQLAVAYSCNLGLSIAFAFR